MIVAIDRVRDGLARVGATLVAELAEGPFVQLTYQTGDVIIRLDSEYGVWRCNIGLADQPLAPSSFWIEALAGRRAFPDPATTDEDMPRLADQMEALVERAPDLAAQVALMADDYSRSLRDRLE